jgi:uncharacterized protein YndB with AHSA1/START domain
MRAYRFEEHIAATPDRVWSVLTDLSAARKWRPLIHSMETEDGRPLGPGSRVRITFDFLGRRDTRTSTTVDYEPERVWTLRSSDKPEMEGVFAFRLEPEGAGTKIVATCELEAHGFLPWLFLPLISYGERQRRKEMLGNLKRLIEGAREELH